MKKLLAVLLMEISSPGAAWEGKHAALLDISDAAQRQAGLFGGGRDHTRLMQVMDSINATWARSTWPQRACQSWRTKRERMSPAYTTDWRQLPQAR